MQNLIFQVKSYAHATDPVCAQGWILKGHGISLFYHVKVMEKLWNLKAKKQHEPCEKAPNQWLIVDALVLCKDWLVK